MIYGSLAAAFLCVAVTVPLSAQISRDARFEIIRTVLAEQAAARIGLPFGNGGVDLSDAGEIDQDKLNNELRRHGQSIAVDQIVTVTNLSFSNNRIEVELDGGGSNRRSILDRIQIGVGGGTTTTNPLPNDRQQATGSKIVLRFSGRVPPELTPDELMQLLDPVLDFSRTNFLTTGVASLPPEFQEAVAVKEARIGMDRNTVLLAMGRPDRRIRERVDGVDREDWIYQHIGFRTTFVTFEGDVVIRIVQHGVQ